MNLPSIRCRVPRKQRPPAVVGGGFQHHGSFRGCLNVVIVQIDDAAGWQIGVRDLHAGKVNVVNGRTAAAESISDSEGDERVIGAGCRNLKGAWGTGSWGGGHIAGNGANTGTIRIDDRDGLIALVRGEQFGAVRRQGKTEGQPSSALTGNSNRHPKAV